MVKMRYQFQFYILLCILLGSCSGKESTPPLMELLSPQRTGITFSNTLREDEDLNVTTFEYFYNGGGIGIGDINNDGLNDIFFSANMGENKLYLNKGKLKFEDISTKAGLISSGKWASGVSIVDINQDGLLDIYVCYAGPFADPVKRTNELYINQGNETFTESAKAYGLDDTGHSVQAAFFDYDLDGDLDVYILTNITDITGPNVIRPKRVHGEMVNTDRLYRNNGNHTFTNVSAEAGITIEGYGLGISICDINNDGWPDVYVSNDYLSNDLLYINNHDGTFTDRMASYFQHTSYSAMGNDVADYNNDGLPDIMAVDMLPPDNKRQKMMFGVTPYDRYRSELKFGYTPQFMRNTLQLNDGKDAEGKPAFSEIGQLAGVSATDWSWSPLFADIDNDGWKDLLISNGYARDITNRDFVSYRMQEFMQQGQDQSRKKKMLDALHSIEGAHLPVFAFRNNGDLTFEDRSSRWGFTTPAYSTGSAYADLDNDGDLEYITNNIDGPAFLFENHAHELLNHHFLRIDLKGPAGNLQGYGAKVFLYNGRDTLQYAEKSPYRGYQSTVEQELHFGLGKHTMVDSLTIVWPDGKRQMIEHIKADQTLRLDHSNATTNDTDNYQADLPLFTSVDKRYDIAYRHDETEYADFKIQPLLPHKYSEYGPGVAVGDVNQDGLEDFYIGGAFKQSGQFFVQGKDGKFTTKKLTHDVKFEEDMGALFFDADGDHDEDLYVVSGGNEFAAGSLYYKDRLYLNDGKGNFKEDKQALPAETASGSCVVAADYDQDGDLDLFVGGRLTPQHYPEPGQSLILQNNRGHFTDVTKEVAPELQHVGMVSAALWTDVDNDHLMDLMVVGEWMPITIFKNEGKRFRHLEIEHSTGWWNSVQGGDFDEDGDTDYIVGNLGLNSRYKTSSEKPVRVYVGDFNHDGIDDPVLAHYIQGVNRPAHPRDDIFLQIVQFRKKYTSYQAYADATMESMLEGTNVQPVVLESETFQSSYLENNGKNAWKLKPLSLRSQFSPVFGIAVGDYDHDGHTDVVLSGNSYATEVLTGRYDASKGLLLKGDGEGSFKDVSLHGSGIRIDGNAKGIAELYNRNNKSILIGVQNNDSLKVFEKRTPNDKIIPVDQDESYALISLSNGKKYKQELYFGSGYLSQSSRKLRIPVHATEVVIFKYSGQRRIISIR
jgi:hypothetical protein